ncbi:MAG: hypothetical protein M3350_10835 [Actinomycetota bacterium]|nr:hypothetical protein [Actinomycetota bacterium]
MRAVGHRPVDAGGHVVRRAAAVVAEHPDGHHRSGGGHARNAAAVVLRALVLPAAAAAADPLRAQQWNLSIVESDAAHGTTAGAGARVAIIDSESRRR